MRKTFVIYPYWYFVHKPILKTKSVIKLVQTKKVPVLYRNHIPVLLGPVLRSRSEPGYFGRSRYRCEGPAPDPVPPRATLFYLDLVPPFFVRSLSRSNLAGAGFGISDFQSRPKEWRIYNTGYSSKI